MGPKTTPSLISKGGGISDTLLREVWLREFFCFTQILLSKFLSSQSLFEIYALKSILDKIFGTNIYFEQTFILNKQNLNKNLF